MNECAHNGTSGRKFGPTQKVVLLVACMALIFHLATMFYLPFLPSLNLSGTQHVRGSPGFSEAVKHIRMLLVPFMVGEVLIIAIFVRDWRRTRRDSADAGHGGVS